MSGPEAAPRILSLGATGLATWFMGSGLILLLLSLYDLTTRFSAKSVSTVISSQMRPSRVLGGI